MSLLSPVATLVTLAALAAKTADPAAASSIPCFLRTAEPVMGYGTPDATSKQRLLFVSELRCGGAIVRDAQGNEFREVQQNDRASPGRAWVRVEDVHLDVARGGPGPEAWLQSLRNHLAAGELGVVEELAMAAEMVMRAPSQKTELAELRRLELALATYRSRLSHEEARIARLRDELDALRREGIRSVPAEPRPERTSPPRAGTRAYVAAVRLRVRGSPDEGGVVLGTLPVGEAIEVAEASGMWARVRSPAPLAATEIWEVRGREARRVTEPRDSVEGWVSWAQLQDEPLSPSALRQRAEQHEAAGRHAEAYRDLERAAALEPPTAEQRAAIRRAAAKAGRYEEALAAAHLDEVVVEGDAHARVAMRTIAGCRGARQRAPILDVGVEFDRFMTDEGLRTDEAFRALPPTACLLASTPTFAATLGSVWSKRPDPVNRRLAREFQDGPWLLVETWVPARALPERSRAFVFELPGVNDDLACPPPEAALSALRISGAVPWPRPGGAQRVWVKLTNVCGFRGVVTARDEADAASRALGLLRDRCAPGSLAFFTYAGFPQSAIGCAR